MKKTLVTFAIAGLLMTSAAAYSDIPDTHWASAQIDKLTQEGLITGYVDSTFRPDRPVTRAEFLTLLTRATMPEEIQQSDTHTYWWDPYYNAIGADMQEWITENLGWSALTMDRPITRFEMARLVNNAVSLNIIYVNYDGTMFDGNSRVAFSDISADAHGFFSPAETAAQQAAATGILAGYTDGTFRGNDTLTRAEVTTVIARLQTHTKNKDKLLAANGTFMITQKKQDNTMTLQSTHMITGELISEISVTLPDTYPSEGTTINYANSNYIWGRAGLFQYDDTGSIHQLAECVDRMVVLNDDILIFAYVQNDAVVFESMDKKTGDRIDTLSVPIDASDFSYLSYNYQNIIVGSNTKFFWGLTGLYTYTSDGKIQPITDEVVIDYSYDRKEQCYVIVTHDKNEQNYVSWSGTALAYGNEIVSLYENGDRKNILDNTPEHLIAITAINSQDGKISFTGTTVMGHSDRYDIVYQMQDGKIQVLSTTNLFLTQDDLDAIQERLNNL